MTQPWVSVIIVSRDRPDDLIRCLMGLQQQFYDRFEVIVVADPVGEVAVRASRFAEVVTLVSFDEPNISVARNLGIAQAAGEIIAFIDDDAVPEPTWLGHLIRAFEDVSVSAAGGFVRGRDGITYQWMAREVGGDGIGHPIDVPMQEISQPSPSAGRAIKTEGTNMAVRRAVLSDMGGFDPAYHFYLDETDLNIRLAARGTMTAVVPMAQVHHAFSASARRRADRVPKSLHQIGASLGVFLRRHGAGFDAALVRDEERATQKRRLLRHMVMGRLEPRDVAPLLKTFDEGWAEGVARPVETLPAIRQLRSTVIPFPVFPRTPNVTLAGRLWHKRGKMAEAAGLVGAEHRVSVYIFRFFPGKHRLTFENKGFWLQEGGLIRSSSSEGPRVRLWRFGKRLEAETARVAEFRQDC